MSLAPARPAVPLRALARREVRHYARHPLFLLGLVLSVAVCAAGPDPASSSLFHVIVPAAGLGVFGLLVMVSLVRRSDQAHAAAGATAVTETQRTLALAAATVVPLLAGLGFLAWAVWAYHREPPLPSTLPFGEVGDAWVYAWLVALGVVPAVGGPVLGLVVGRWLHFRGAGLVCAVLLVLGTVVMQGLVEPLRFVRVLWPWTYFGGPYGTDDGADRWVLFTGSPGWYVGYLLALCVLGVLLALLHDREAPRERLLRALGVVGALAALLAVLAMTQGPAEAVNPLPAPRVGTGG